MPHQCTNCDRTFADGSKEMLSGCPDCGGTKFQFRPNGFDGGSDAGDSAAADTGSASASTAETPPEPTDRPGDAMTRTVGNAAATVRDLVSGSAGKDATSATPPTDESPSEPATASKSQTTSKSTSTTRTKSASESDTESPDPSDSSFDDDIIIAESKPVAGEDTAQADARSAVADPEELPDSESFDPAEDDSDPSTTAETEDVDGNEAEPSQSPEASPEDDATDRTVADEPDAERADRPDLAELREELNDQFESIRVVEPGQYELNLMELYDREEYIIALQEDGRYSIQVPETWRQADA
ncbi:OapC/ArvC family zinc-ribbon domain-containing protein [Halosimplex sp. J119]